MDAKTAFISTRPWSFTMTFSSVSVGTLVAALGGKFSPPLYALTLGGMVLFHAATNVLNDFFDVRHGVDREGTPTTKYRLHPAALGQTPASTILGLSISLYVLTFAIGLYLAAVSGALVMVVLCAGVVGSVFYTGDPVVLKKHALGEATVFLMWGALIPLGAYLVQTGSLSWYPVAASAPVGAFVALVLLANNIRDTDYDAASGTRTLAVALGTKAARSVYSALLAAAYAVVALGVVARLLPLWSLLVFLTVPEARGLPGMFKAQVPDNADPRTAALALKFSVLYIISMILSVALPLFLPL